MAKNIKLEDNLIELMTTFNIIDATKCTQLDEWMSASYAINEFEGQILDDLYEDIKVSGEYMNEEELKTRMVSFLFYAAKVDEPNKIRVFYERPLSATIENHALHVIADCMVAAPFKSSPQMPYFFLQEFKKLRFK